MNYAIAKDNYSISTDKSKIDIEYIHAFLTKSYWPPGTAAGLCKKVMENDAGFTAIHNPGGHMV